VIVAVRMARAISPSVIAVIVIARGPRAAAFGTALTVFTRTRRTAIGARTLGRAGSSPFARSAWASWSARTRRSNLAHPRYKPLEFFAAKLTVAVFVEPVEQSHGWRRAIRPTSIGAALRTMAVRTVTIPGTPFRAAGRPRAARTFALAALSHEFAGMFVTILACFGTLLVVQLAVLVDVEFLEHLLPHFLERRSLRPLALVCIGGLFFFTVLRSGVFLVRFLAPRHAGEHCRQE
jgi:hypothetical protein